MTDERIAEIAARFEREAAAMDLRDLPRRDVLDLFAEVDRLASENNVWRTRHAHLQERHESLRQVLAETRALAAALVSPRVETEGDAALRWRITTLQSALENWGRHFEWCESRGGQSCNCGFDAALSRPPITREWCIAAANAEGEAEIGVGRPPRRSQGRHGKMIGQRVEWGETGPSNPGEFAKHPQAGWHAMTPNGHGANLTLHSVMEHEDGTITVSPSILVLSAPDAPGESRSRPERELWHGFLERGVWREC